MSNDRLNASGRHRIVLLLVAAIELVGWRALLGATADEQAACAALIDTPNLTITRAQIVAAKGATPEYCYVRGTIAPAIRYHLQLPLPGNWNGRFLNWGDGGKDGDLDFADARLAEGYAVANSNTGHDNGSEPGASFAFNNRQAEIDFGYRAVHLTVNAAKTAIAAYYGQPARYAYHEGCSTGGRQGLMEAQRFPDDFDGIVAGAPVAFYQQQNLRTVWISQQLFADHFAGNLAYDADGDGVAENLDKLELLASAVIDKCDVIDGIKDGVIDNPLRCAFDPASDLKSLACPRDQDGARCFTARQLATIEKLYQGPRDSRGRQIYAGQPFGSERFWSVLIPNAGNHMQPAAVSADHINYLFYETDPGVAVSNPGDLSYVPRPDGPLPEFAWWNFNVDDYTAGKGDFMKAITDATDTDMRRFFYAHDGKLLLYHGWADGLAVPQPIFEYYADVVADTFGGDIARARERARLFMMPGMYHCRGGPGPDEFDPLTPLVTWVEQGRAPEYLVARHRSNGAVDNERRVCAEPQHALFTGPAGTANDPGSWVESNFSCR